MVLLDCLKARRGQLVLLLAVTLYVHLHQSRRYALNNSQYNAECFITVQLLSEFGCHFLLRRKELRKGDWVN